MDTNNDIYRRIHFAVMAIESEARKLGISLPEMPDRLSKQGLIQKDLSKGMRNFIHKASIGLPTTLARHF